MSTFRALNAIDPIRLAGVYLLTPDTDDADFGRVLAIVEQALQAGVRVIQYREKKAAIAVQFSRSERLRRLTRRADALLIINDSVEVAAHCEADGVHLGRADGEVFAARQRLGHRLVGVSCYNEVGSAQAAIAASADAIAFGSIYPSATKPDAVRAPLALVTQARATWPQCRTVAIGGINASNVANVAAAGAHAAAVLDAVFAARDPAQAASELVQRFEQGRRNYEEQRTAL